VAACGPVAENTAAAAVQSTSDRDARLPVQAGRA
jgi:hypothetical protein